MTGDVEQSTTVKVPAYHELPPMKQEFFVLLELFDPVGNSRGLYWAGKRNHLAYHPLGLEVTFDVLKARKIPMDMKDVAEQLATAANKAYPSATGTWVATEHGFIG